LKTLQETNSQTDHDDSDSDDSYAKLQNPTKAETISNNFLNALPECPTIHWPTEMFNDPQLCFCPYSTQTELWRGKMNVSIHDDHVYKSTNMTLNQLMKHLKDEGDPNHKAILAYLNNFSFFRQDYARQQHSAMNLMSRPVGNHDKLAGARSATAVHQKTITGGGENTVTGGSDLSLKGPDKEVTDGAGVQLAILPKLKIQQDEKRKKRMLTLT
jgi:hypothetical protein